MVGWVVSIVRVSVGLAFGITGFFVSVIGLVDRPVNAVVAVIGVGMILGGVLLWPRSKDRWRKDPPTQKQLAYAASLGIAIPNGASKGQVSDLISQVTGR